MFAVVAFWAFVIGGLAFGGIFIVNWRTIGALTSVNERPPILVAAGPVSVKMPVTITSPAAPMTIPSKPAEITTSIASVVKVVLPEWTGTDRVNIVLLGIDKRDDEPISGTRSDTIMLVSIDPVSKSAALVSLPRDLWVSIPGYGPQRINVAHSVGGPDLTKSTINSAFGVPIQYYARVDFRGFEELIDTTGGVIVDVDRPLKDDAYPTEDYGYKRIYYAPGPQLLDGRHALEYARSRHGSNDFSRARRQQHVLVSLRDRALQLNMLSKAPEMIGIVQKSLTTDLPPRDLLALAKLVSDIDRDRIGNLVVDTNYARPINIGGADVLVPDAPAVRRAIDSTLRSAAHPELRARVEVLNGSGTAGLGQRAADYLRAQGYNVVRVAAAERNAPSSVLEVLTNDQQASEALANALGVPPTAINDTPSPNAGVDIRLIVGQDFRLPAR